MGLHAEAVWKPVCRIPCFARRSRLGVRIYTSSQHNFMLTCRESTVGVSMNLWSRSKFPVITHLGAERADIAEPEVVGENLSQSE